MAQRDINPQGSDRRTLKQAVGSFCSVDQLLLQVRAHLLAPSLQLPELPADFLSSPGSKRWESSKQWVSTIGTAPLGGHLALTQSNWIALSLSMPSEPCSASLSLTSSLSHRDSPPQSQDNWEACVQRAGGRGCCTRNTSQGLFSPCHCHHFCLSS